MLENRDDDDDAHIAKVPNQISFFWAQQNRILCFFKSSPSLILEVFSIF